MEKERCEICGEKLRRDDNVAEMYSADMDDTDDSVIVHFECGNLHGMLLA
jgi:transcription initiation factor IIE alpha subunit